KPPDEPRFRHELVLDMQNSPRYACLLSTMLGASQSMVQKSSQTTTESCFFHCRRPRQTTSTQVCVCFRQQIYLTTCPGSMCGPPCLERPFLSNRTQRLPLFPSRRILGTRYPFAWKCNRLEDRA